MIFFFQGKPSIISIWAENSVGLVSKRTTSAIVVDDSTPQSGSVVCPQYIQVGRKNIPFSSNGSIQRVLLKQSALYEHMHVITLYFHAVIMIVFFSCAA